MLKTGLKPLREVIPAFYKRLSWAEKFVIAIQIWVLFFAIGTSNILASFATGSVIVLMFVCAFQLQVIEDYRKLTDNIMNEQTTKLFDQFLHQQDPPNESRKWN
jgi:hypothetical protein